MRPSLEAGGPHRGNEVRIAIMCSILMYELEANSGAQVP